MTLLAFFLRVKTVDGVVSYGGDKFRLTNLLLLKGPGFLSPAVHRLDFPYLIGRQRVKLCKRAFFIGEIKDSGKDVCLYQEGLAVFQFQRFVNPGEAGAGIGIGLNLIIEAAFELAALAGQLLGVEREVLGAGRGGCPS